MYYLNKSCIPVFAKECLLYIMVTLEDFAFLILLSSWFLFYLSVGEEGDGGHALDWSLGILPRSKFQRCSWLSEQWVSTSPLTSWLCSPLQELQKLPTSPQGHGLGLAQKESASTYLNSWTGSWTRVPENTKLMIYLWAIAHLWTCISHSFACL